MLLAVRPAVTAVLLPSPVAPARPEPAGSPGMLDGGSAPATVEERASTGTVPFVARLAEHGTATALVTADRSMSYAELAAAVERTAPALGAGRRLVLVAGANRVDVVVHYLAALHAGHPVLLVPEHGPALDTLVARYDPDVVVRPSAAGDVVVQERRSGTAHSLHPDLALLLSTSGSTGSPRLVRLSHENLQTNAESIAEALAILPSDRAATTVPLHYCYGLSVLHSHLERGAAVLLTDLSVVDTCFWDLFRRERGTALAGVPYTFELLDRVGFAEMDLPHLRRVTQAGGRMEPPTVRRFAELGGRRGWDLVVMYGQTEATARMAYLPPHLAAGHPEAIGRAVPGGSLRLRPAPESTEPGVGELVYAGPNVMLGYADGPADLALGRSVTELATGDLGRITADGLVEVVGRRSRFIKALGLRIDLDEVERTLAGLGMVASCAGEDERVVVALAGEELSPAPVQRWLSDRLGLPSACVQVVTVPDLPRLANGKPDRRAVLALAPDRVGVPGARPVGRADPAAPAATASAEDLRALYAEVLDRPEADLDSTFVGLGGDSLSYVEMSLRLEESLGHLPAGWHTTPVRDLVPRAPGSRRRRLGTDLEMSVALRALAIVLVVATHANVLSVVGGAHLLLGVAGFNFGRFQVGAPDRSHRLRSVGASIARLVVPSIVWIAGAAAVTGMYTPATALLLTNVLGPDRWGVQWHFWFLEAVLHIVVAVTALLTIPVVDRLERRSPFGVALAVLAVGLVFRFEVLVMETGPRIQTPHNVLWLFALGWAASRASSLWQRLVVSGVAVVVVPGFFDNPSREAIVIGALCLLVWVTSVPCPRRVARAAGVLASSSLYVYVTHWVVYPHLEDEVPLLAAGLSFVVGIAYWRLSTTVMHRVARQWADRPSRALARTSRPGASSLTAWPRSERMSGTTTR
ncbi:MAG: AMP-dependent synthetase and ligase [Actinotalea sp.]|nr:AMP-dependent synthetase and ligase [Actinotalea sp.]